MNYHNEPILEGFIRVIEVCPHCGAEIDIIVPEGAEKLNFCPNCGERDILLSPNAKMKSEIAALLLLVHIAMVILVRASRDLSLSTIPLG